MRLEFLDEEHPRDQLEESLSDDERDVGRDLPFASTYICVAMRDGSFQSGSAQRAA